MFGDRCLGLVGCGHSTNWTCGCTCNEVIARDDREIEPTQPTKADEAARLKAQIEGMALYVQHDGSCRANDFDYLDKTPCICGLRTFYNPKGQQGGSGE